MRVSILAVFVLGILVSANVAKAGPSTTDRDLVASADPAIVADEATQETEDRIGLDKAKRRGVQRRMTRLGFDTKINGKFDDPTRAVIARWQAARGYPRTGFLNEMQYQALLTELSRWRTPASLPATTPMPIARPDIAAEVGLTTAAVAVQLG